MTVKFLDLIAQYESIKTEIDEAVAGVISNASFIGGQDVADFEEEFARFQQAAHCVGVGNGTDALEIALEALAMPPGSDVIVPANSFIASSEAVTRAGHRVVFCDIDPDTYLIDFDDLERRLTPRTRAVIAVHLYGRPCDMTTLMRMADKHEFAVVEDAAQAHGAEHAGRRVGALGHIGTFSFYPGKNLGAYGDGGAICTNDPALAKQCRMAANHGRSDKYLHEFEGRNSRLDSLQAAVLNVKLHHLDAWIDQRNQVAQTYTESLGELPGLTVPGTVPNGDRHAFHLYVIRISDPSGLALHLDALGIATGRHYPTALPDQPAYAGVACLAPRASRLASSILSLPIGEHVTTRAASRVANAVTEHLAHQPGS